MNVTVAALYVERNGVYWNLPGVDPWDEERDARAYPGPHPVVAHPPCGTWCTLAYLNQAKGVLTVGDDGGCFAAALAAVERWGGILEHPAHTAAWARYGLPAPARYGWTQTWDRPGFATEIDQHAYGTLPRKRTWLYYVGQQPPELDWREYSGSVIVSDLGPGGTRRRGDEWQPGVQYASASRTPEAFRDVLVDAARSSAWRQVGAAAS